MPISATCSCGHQYYIHNRFAGQQRKCLYCGNSYTVPSEPDPPRIVADANPPEHTVDSVFESWRQTNAPSDSAAGAGEPYLQPSTRSAYSPAYAPPAPKSLAPVERPDWKRWYLILVIALIPLMVSSFQTEKPDDVLTRYNETLQSLNEEQREEFAKVAAREGPGGGSEQDLINAFPGHKIKGALLPISTKIHWLYAFASALVFLLLIMLAMPSNTTSPLFLSITAVFTGTIGIILLLAAQFLAFSMPWIRGGGVIAIICLILKVIGLAYELALSNDYGFALSLLGFTFGVGLCEEICKSLPVFHHFTTIGKKMDWRGACIWGLASGVGFGVSEGITYSSDYYNGITGGNIYLIRFISCVALHAIWAGAAGINLWKNRHHLQDAHLTNWDRFFNLCWIVFPPMLMHGLYDTLLKFDCHILAMLTAIGSFAYFAAVVERAKRIERELEPNVVLV